MKIELLPVSRWDELKRAFEESRSDEQLPKPENSVILGAHEGERLIGCIGAQKMWWVSPFWIDKEHRGNGLAHELAVNLGAYNVEGFSELCTTTNPHVEQLVYSLGFIPVRGRMWRRDGRR